MGADVMMRHGPRNCAPLDPPVPRAATGRAAKRPAARWPRRRDVADERRRRLREAHRDEPTARSSSSRPRASAAAFRGTRCSRRRASSASTSIRSAAGAASAGAARSRSARAVRQARHHLDGRPLSPSARSRSATPASAGLADGRRLVLPGAAQGDVVVDVPADSQVHRQVVRKRAEVARDRARSGRAAALCRGRRARHARSARRFRSGCRRRWASSGSCDEPRPSTCGAARAAEGAAQGRLEGHRRRARRARGSSRIWPGLHERAYGLAVDIGSTTIAGASVRPRQRRGGGLRRAHEPADPLRRGPDEPGLLRDDEPGRRGRDDRRGARGARRARRRAVRRGRHRPQRRCSR